MSLLMRVTGAPHIENLLGNKGSWEPQAQELSVHIFDRTSIILRNNSLRKPLHRISTAGISAPSQKVICLKVRTCTESA